jgi:predicted O-methyltransferase YrrM
MSESTEGGRDYDALPYEGGVFAVTHPDHLCALARLFGVAAPDPTEARVLELGCSVGTNLLPMAAGAPQARFVGIDQSAVQIGIAEQRRAQLGLDNCRLVAGDLREIDEQWGTFDYIICHGVYSWVPEAVRAAILRLCKERLSPRGVAYISYNVLPGWLPMLGVREALRAHTEGIEGAQERVSQARAFLAFMASLEPESSDPWHATMRTAHAQLERCPDSYLLHEYLAPVNAPCTFLDFVAAARSHGLQYLAEADLPTMIPANCGANAREVLDQIHGQAQSEQYLDLLRGRRFRQTLLVHGDLEVDRDLRPPRLAGVRLLPRFEVLESPPQAGRLVLRAENEAELTLLDPLLQRAFLALQAASPRNPTVESLAAAGGLAGDPVAEEAVADAMLTAATRGFVTLCARPRARAPTDLSRPLAWPAASAWARWGGAVPSQLHRAVLPSPLGRLLLQSCDGARDQNDLIQVVLDAMEAGELEIEAQGAGGEALGAPSVEGLAALVQEQVAELARLGLLIDAPARR